MISIPSIRYILVWILVGMVLWVTVRTIRERNDPLGSYTTTYQPEFSTVFLNGMRQYDPLTHDDIVHALKEFSRLYQTSFLVDQDIRAIVKHMSRQRRLVHRHVHALRQYLPNDTVLEKQLLVGLEHTDGGMAWCLSDIVRRHPHVKLLYGAGVVHQGPRSVDDTWS